MKPPKRLKIGPSYVKVIFTKRLEEGIIGSFHPDRGVELAAHLKGGELADTFIHEVLHALFHFFAIEEGRPEETIVGQVAALITVFWSQNPGALKWWGGLLENG